MKKPDKPYIIWKDSRWIQLLPERYKFTLTRSGKWVYQDTSENLEKIAFKLTPLIEEGLALQIKYKHSPSPPESRYHGIPPVMCVYCSDRNKSEVEKRLREHGLKDIFWKE